MRSFLTTVAALCLPILLAAQSQESPRQIIERVDRLLRGESSHSVATMEVVTEHWTRGITVELWSLGTDYSLVRVLAPAKEEGMATLMADNDIWNYLPKVDRTIKIPAAMLGSSWTGSHFTNDDLVKESQLVDDYDIEIAFDGERGGARVWEFRLTPKAEAAVVWGHLEFQVRQDDYMPLWARYYDEDGDLSRTMTYSEFRRVGPRTLPAVMTMQPDDKPRESTTVRYTEIEFDVDVDRSFFSLQALKRRR